MNGGYKPKESLFYIDSVWGNLKNVFLNVPGSDGISLSSDCFNSSEVHVCGNVRTLKQETKYRIFALQGTLPLAISHRVLCRQYLNSCGSSRSVTCTAAWLKGYIISLLCPSVKTRVVISIQKHLLAHFKRK